MNLVLCGHKGAGKTSVAKCYAQRFDIHFYDSDDLIRAYCREVHGIEGDHCDIFTILGEADFREVEARVIAQLPEDEHMIIATGGGSVLNEDNVSRLKQLGTMIFLSVDRATLAQRILSPTCRTALIPDREAFNHYWSAREGTYDRVADHTLSLQDESIEEIVDLLENYRQTHGK